MDALDITCRNCGHIFREHTYSQNSIWFCQDGFCPCDNFISISNGGFLNIEVGKESFKYN